MKKILLSFISLAYIGMSVFSQDIPPASANVQNLPSGSYVIAMDKNLQGDGTNFNLNAYGLVTYLLNNNVRVRWVINSTKAKDGIDFTVNATRIKPTAAGVASRNFIAGPFVIFSTDLPANINTLIDNFNGFAGTSTDVNVYQTTAAVNVDVRYDYQINGVIWKPKAALLNDGLNWDIHRKYFYDAGIEGAGFNENAGNTSSTNWVQSSASDLPINCFTIATEAHWEQTSPTAAEISLMNGVKTFVLNGGNFLAECAAVRTYENTLRLHSTGGIDPATEKDFKGASSLVIYPNPGISYSQFDGAVDIDKGGSLTNWTYLGSLQNNEHDHAKAPNSGTGANNIGASVARITNSSPGGLVFYLGNHEYNTTGTPDVANGVRMYLNAFLTPTNPQGSLKTAAVTFCASYPTPVTVNCGSSAGPTNAYPLTFTLYEDLAPAGYNVGDPQLGNVVTMTAPNTFQGGISLITAPALLNSSKNYVVAIRPAGTCLQPKYLQSVCSTLPVLLMDFTAKRNSSIVNLVWSSSTEQNNKGYEIERMIGTGNWETIGFVNSLAPNGNSNSELNYSFNDFNNTKGISQYRLRQIDLDAKARLSEIRAVKGLDQKGKIIIYPNPTTDGNVNVVFEQGNIIRDISVIDMSGRTVKQMRNITSNNVKIENLTPGMYTIRILVPETGEQTVEKIVVNKR